MFFICLPKLEHAIRGGTRLDGAGQEASLAPPCSSLRFFGSKSTVLKEVLATLLRLFGASSDDLAPGELCSLSLRPCMPFLAIFLKVSIVSVKKYCETHADQLHSGLHNVNER